MKQMQWVTLGLLILLPLLVYFQSLGNVFVAFDDELLILDNPTAQGLNVENVKRAFTTYDPELYVPLTMLSYQVEYSLFGLSPTVYHATSLALHILSGLLVFGIFQFFFNRKIALVLGLLFALHPVNVETVAWASGRKDVLSSLFFLLSLFLYLRWRDTGKGYFLSVATFGLGLLSKVSIVPLPFALLLIDWFQGNKIDRSNLKEKLPYFALALLFIVIALFGKAQVSDVRTWVLLSFISIPFHLFTYVIPTNLSIFYPFMGEVSLTHPMIATGLTATAVLAIATIVSLRWTKHIAFAALWFLLLLGPTFVNSIKGGEDGAVQLYFASDRYIYLAGLGVLFLIGFALERIQTKGAGVRPAQENRRRNACSRMLWVSSLGVIALFAVLTTRQSLVWRDSEALFSNVVDQRRPAYAAYLGLARVHAEREDFNRAIELYQESLAHHRSSKALLNLGQLYARQGRNPEAIEMYEQVVESWPDVADVHQSLGELSLKEGNFEHARSSLERAIEINGNLIPAHFNLGVLYEHLGRNEDAIAAFQRVLELKPDDTQALEKLRTYGEQ